jgi:hypothetical protein
VQASIHYECSVQNGSLLVARFVDDPCSLPQFDLRIGPKGHRGVERSTRHEEVASARQHLLPCLFQAHDFE